VTTLPNSGVYAITNIENGKIYIGSTVDFEHRWGQHRSDLQHNCHHNSHLQHSWNKYGEETFEFGVLEYLDNIEELTNAEQFWMDKYREEGKELYNFGLAADNAMRGQIHSEESRRKMSKVMMGRKLTEDHRRKIGDASRDRAVSEETRRKISEIQRGRVFTGEHRCKISAAMKGKRNHKGCRHSEETKRKLSEAAKGRPNGMLGKKHSEETKRKIGRSKVGNQNCLGRKLSEETRRKIGEAHKGKKLSDEHKLKISKSLRARVKLSEYNDTIKDV